MTAFTAANYLSNSGRTEAEMKTAFEDNLAATKQLLGAAAASTLTLAADQITPTGGFHLVETQAAASTDNLAQVLQTNLPDGSFLLLAIATNGHTVVAKHAAGGTGQLSLASGADFSMTHTSMSLLLQRSGTSWIERDRYFGNQTAAFAAYYAASGLGQNLFTGRQEWKQGPDIASGSTLALGTDGNYFNVTGTTTINNVSSAQAGTWIRLRFASAGCQLTASASLVLQAGTHLTRAGDVLELVSDGSGNWREAAPLGTPRIIDLVTSSVTVANTVTETAVYTKAIPGGLLGTARRLRLLVHGTWKWNVVQLFGATTVYGTRFRLKYGATTIADAFIAGGVWDNAGGAGYVYGPNAMGLTLEGVVAATGATNAQFGRLTGGAPFGFGGTAGGSSNGSETIRNFGLPLGLIITDVNGTVTPAAGTATEDSTASKNLVLSVEHNLASTSDEFKLYAATLELLP